MFGMKEHLQFKMAMPQTHRIENWSSALFTAFGNVQNVEIYNTILVHVRSATSDLS